MGFGIEFDGVDDYVEIIGFKGISDTASRTCTAWIKTSVPSSQIINWGSTDPGAKWAVRVKDDSSTDISEAMLYVDGEIEPIGGYVASPVDTAISEDVKIGINIIGTVFFQGLIDDVRIYDRALTDEEVQIIAGMGSLSE